VMRMNSKRTFTQRMNRQSRTKKNWSSARGANLVEVALILMLLLSLTFAVIDFGTVLYVYLALENGVSQATRYAVTGQQMPDPSDPQQKLPRDESIRRAMRQATPTLPIPDNTFSFYNVTKGVSGTGGPNDVIRVTVNYPWNSFTPLLRPFFNNGQITLRVSSTMKNEPFS
jgi:TadE-like protein